MRPCWWPLQLRLVTMADSMLQALCRKALPIFAEVVQRRPPSSQFVVNQRAPRGSRVATCQKEASTAKACGIQ
eukprot:Skav231201  [mRNA]  locus=scaffold2432:63585:71511:- [translate_table: standard]